MPITHSAAKRLRQDKKRSRKNSLLRTKLDLAKKAILKTSKQQNSTATQQQLRTFMSLVDKMERKGTLKRNTAARIKSRMTKK